MLQQTQVSRVVGYYDRFLARFPTLQSVADARPGQVREAWRGLGYYARARNLHRLAREVSPPNGNGAMPAEPEALRQLPGVGAYTAGAVASFAYERRAALVDTNVARVLRRVFAPRIDPKSSKGQRVLWELAESVLPRTGKSTWTHNQAVMELGALVCTARVMHCDACPVRTLCLTARGNRQKAPGTRGGERESGRPARSPHLVSDARCLVPISSPDGSGRAHACTAARRTPCRSAADARSSAPCPAASPPTAPASPPSAPPRRAP